MTRRTSDQPMTPERWRIVDAIIQGALACESARRDAFVAKACGDDEALRLEVMSLLGAHERSDDGFLERPAAEALGALIAQPLVGARLAKALAGRYVVEHELAHGGMATVHLARDIRHDRLVAVKVLRDEVAAALGAERFLQEIRVTASLQHPNILPLFDSGSDDGLLWYVMPYVDGETMRSRLAREGRLPLDLAVQLVREMADALDYAHRHGVVHRDVKPENVLLHDGHALVADFGIALALEKAGGERLTRTGITLGTPQYMSPEQAIGSRTIDARTDVYALGAVLYEMIAGEPPFAATSRQAVLRRLMHEPATALSMRRADVPPSLDAAVRWALAKRPDDRFPSAAAFSAALALPPSLVESGSDVSGALEADSYQETPYDGERSPSRGRRVSARTAAYAAAFSLLLGLAGGWALGRSQLAERWRGVPAAPWSAPPISAAGWMPPANDGSIALTVVDRGGRSLRSIPAMRPWTPRFSPDGKRIAYGALRDEEGSSELWVTDLASGATMQVTNDDRDSNDPHWSKDGSSLVYSVGAPGGKDLVVHRLGGKPKVISTRDGTQYPSDWLRDGSAFLVTEETANNARDILVQPADGSVAWPYATTSAEETAARISPDKKWVAYTSNESGSPEVYLDSYPRPSRRVKVSDGGGIHPVWRGDGSELYYWRNDALVAVRVQKAMDDWPPSFGEPQVLFRSRYHVGANTMYDVTADGERFVIVSGR